LVVVIKDSPYEACTTIKASSEAVAGASFVFKWELWSEEVAKHGLVSIEA